MEREVLAGLVAEGLTLEQLGDRLGLHPSTVSYWLKKLDLRPERRAVYAPKGGLHHSVLAREARPQDSTSAPRAHAPGFG
jgi:transcriptional regulator with XRE-family HTH domain